MKENEPINEIQELQLRLMEETEIESFHGPKVAGGLRQFRQLWRAAIFMRDPSWAPLMPLRDLEDGIWSANTVYVLSSGKDDEKLELLGKTWDTEEVHWIEGKDAEEMLGGADKGARIMEVWWT